MRRRSIQLSFLVILSAWGLLVGCITPTPSVPDQTQSRQSFLWSAQRGEETLTLVGTMHIGIRPDDMDPKLWDRLAEADTVLIETDLHRYQPGLEQRFLLLPPGKDLHQLLGPKHWLLLHKILHDAGHNTSEEQLRRMSALAVGTLLLQVQANAHLEIEAGSFSIDQIIFERAKYLHKKTATFESNHEQFSYLEQVFTVETLQTMLEEWGHETVNYSRMKDAFKTGDSEALEAMLDEFPVAMRQVLLDQRNANWLRALPRLKGKRHTLIAVGAAHFAGKNGLLALLKADGYQINRLED